MSARFRRRFPRRRRRLRKDDLRKGIYILPNLFTSASLFAGFYSIVATLNGDFERAAWAIILSGFCDAADGRIARLTASTSKFGVEYDSLADLLAFGLAPGLLVYEWGLRSYGKWGWSVAFLYVVCGALRLARYNVQIDDVEAISFKGLPIPAAAGMIVGTVLIFYKFDQAGPVEHPAVLLLVFLLAILMVSSIKFSSFKELDLRRRKPFPVLLAIIVLLILIVNEPQIVGFTLVLLYVLHGPVLSLVLRRRRAGEPEPPFPTDLTQGTKGDGGTETTGEGEYSP
jgi:CDP-diacylglycerol---serine O-phosphatidyltransferase